ncbi:MAG: hypothetical protein ABIO94_03075, partial [Opitutaceae bacterium]
MGICPPSGVGALIICIKTPNTIPPAMPATAPEATLLRIVISSLDLSSLPNAVLRPDYGPVRST